MKVAPIKVWSDGYIDNYPEFTKLAIDQTNVFWPGEEIKVEKDKQDLLVNVTPGEKHGIVTTLKLFTKYELFVGNEHWGSRIAKAYPQVGVQRMAAAFAHVELNSHAPFYNKINEELGLDTYEFYTSYLNDPVLAARMAMLDELVASKDDELSTAVFSLLEGAVLYSSFAYLKHFQSQGKNKAQNIVRGVNMSVRDENMHSVGGAGLVNVTLAEQQRTEYELRQFRQAVREAGQSLLEHEYLINAKTLEVGNHDGYTLLQANRFSLSRVNHCLKQVGCEELEKVTYNPVGEWFYKGINDYQMNDFFQGVGREYQRDWDSSSFIWPKKAD